jgi:hypothetical protein
MTDWLRSQFLDIIWTIFASDDGQLPWTTRCFFCNDTIPYSSCIDHFKNDCQDLNWIQDAHNGTQELLNSSIIDDKLNGFDTVCIILPNTVIMLRTTAGSEFDELRTSYDVAVVGSDPVQVKYSEKMTDTLIKYVLLDIKPSESFKDFDVSTVMIVKGVLRIVQVESEEDNESINTTQFFLGLCDDIKERDKSNITSRDT